MPESFHSMSVMLARNVDRSSHRVFAVDLLRELGMEVEVVVAALQCWQPKLGRSE